MLASLWHPLLLAHLMLRRNQQLASNQPNIISPSPSGFWPQHRLIWERRQRRTKKASHLDPAQPLHLLVSVKGQCLAQSARTHAVFIVLCNCTPWTSRSTRDPAVLPLMTAVFMDPECKTKRYLNWVKKKTQSPAHPNNQCYTTWLFP